MYNAVRSRVTFNDFEFDSSHSSSYNKEIPLSDRAIGFQEVRLEVNVKEIPSETFNGVINWEDVNASAVLDVSASMNRDDVTKPNAEIASNDLVDANLCGLHVIVREHNQDRVTAFLSFQ